MSTVVSLDASSKMELHNMAESCLKAVSLQDRRRRRQGPPGLGGQQRGLDHVPCPSDPLPTRGVLQPDCGTYLDLRERAMKLGLHSNTPPDNMLMIAEVLFCLREVSIITLRIRRALLQPPLLGLPLIPPLQCVLSRPHAQTRRASTSPNNYFLKHSEVFPPAADVFHSLGNFAMSAYPTNLFQVPITPSGAPPSAASLLRAHAPAAPAARGASKLYVVDGVEITSIDLYREIRCVDLLHPAHSEELLKCLAPLRQTGRLPQLAGDGARRPCVPHSGGWSASTNLMCVRNPPLPP